MSTVDKLRRCRRKGKLDTSFTEGFARTPVTPSHRLGRTDTRYRNGIRDKSVPVRVDIPHTQSFSSCHSSSLTSPPDPSGTFSSPVSRLSFRKVRCPGPTSYPSDGCESTTHTGRHTGTSSVTGELKPHPVPNFVSRFGSFLFSY